jgi:hypothetical protein
MLFSQKPGFTSSFRCSYVLCPPTYHLKYAAGGELFRYIRQQPEYRLPEEHVRFYGAEVLLALEYMHALGFIYRGTPSLDAVTVLLPYSGVLLLFLLCYCCCTQSSQNHCTEQDSTEMVLV